jgi:hypothetical protein
MNRADLIKEVTDFITTNIEDAEEVDLAEAAAAIEDYVLSLEDEEDDEDEDENDDEAEPEGETESGS